MALQTKTLTNVQTHHLSLPRGNTLPSRLPATFLSGVKKISREQAGHIRHFHNLATQRDGDWNFMGTQEPGQEWLDSYRYQLAIMCYASGAAHYHHLPALRSIFKSLFESIIHKMLLRDVWGYWYLTSQSGIFVDPNIKELRKPWADPIVRENIMVSFSQEVDIYPVLIHSKYSGHLLKMVSLFEMLFDSDKYSKEGALTFRWNPFFWGMGPQTFSYTRRSLQDAIIREMEREKWLGACCEPNSIFVNCNQFPIIGIRYSDVVDGTNNVQDVLKKYSAAWEKVGMFQENGLLFEWYSPNQDSKHISHEIGGTAWAAAFMNTWNPEIARQTWKIARWYLSRVEGGVITINEPHVAIALKKLIEEGEDPSLLSTLTKAQKIAGDSTVVLPYRRPIYGYVAQWVSELGDQDTLDGILAYADKNFNPTWHQGGLYYPSDFARDDDHVVDPFTGNSSIGYARLNVSNGAKKMWEEPWSAQHHSKHPFIDNVTLGGGVDFLRGFWDTQRNAIVLTARSWNNEPRTIRPQFRNLSPGLYGIYVNGALGDVKAITSTDNFFEIEVVVAGEELDLVILSDQE